MTTGRIQKRDSAAHLRTAVLALLLGLLMGCPPEGPPSLDFSNLTDARFGQEYSGQIYLQYYDGPASFTQVGGELPPGLSMDEAGLVTGTPEYLGTFTFEVLATRLSGYEDLTDTASLEVVLPEGCSCDDSNFLTEVACVEAGHIWACFDVVVHVGYEHDQLNNMTESLDLMRDIWLRITGGGIQGEGVNSWTMNPGLYLPGPNGVDDGGDRDDERVGDLNFRDLDIEFTNWEATGPTPANPPSYPSEHVPEGGDIGSPRISSGGTFTAGADGGEANVRLSHPDYSGALERRLLIVPPDWCPVGEDEDGGPGGWSTTRYCEGPKSE
jgi:hypothetical protein